MTQGMVYIIETILDKPELWGDLGLSEADLTMLREYNASLTRKVSEEEARQFLDELDAFSFGQRMKEQRDDLLAACIAFSDAHYIEDNRVSVDPQDWAEFDAAIAAARPATEPERTV